MSVCVCVCESPTLYQMMDVLDGTSVTSSLFLSIEEPSISLVLIVSSLIAPVWRQQSLIRSPFRSYLPLWHWWWEYRRCQWNWWWRTVGRVSWLQIIPVGAGRVRQWTEKMEWCWQHQLMSIRMFATGCRCTSEVHVLCAVLVSTQSVMSPTLSLFVFLHTFLPNQNFSFIFFYFLVFFSPPRLVHTAFKEVANSVVVKEFKRWNTIQKFFQIFKNLIVY